MKKHYETYVEDTDKLISVAGPVLDYKSWYEQYRKLMEEQAQRKYGLYTPTSEGDDDFPSISGMIARYSALGLTNEQMTANPVWKDLTGNGHDLQMKNFAWGGMSGVGGYTENYNSNKWYKVGTRIDATWTYKSFNVKSIKENNAAQLFYQSLSSDTGFRVLSCTIKVSGLTDGQGIEYVSNGTRPTVIMRIENDGIYHLPSFDFGAKNAYYGFKFLKLQESCNITIEQLPLYPGALVFDGVDDYGTCDNFPILTKEKGYTVVALRQWIEEKNSVTALASNSKNWNQDGAFVFEYNNLENNYPNIEISFGSNNMFDRGLSPYSYQTSKSYNGNLIESGSFLGSDKLVVAKANENLSPNSNIAIWELVFLDHDATEEELTKIKDYFVKTYPWLFPDQAWTVTGKTNEDEDRATIVNITGNGNDLVLSNFGFAEGSGYGLYYQYFGNEFKATNGEIEGGGWNIIDNYNISHDKRIPINSIGKCFWGNKALVNGIKLRFKLTGMTEGDVLAFGYAATYDLTYTSDGIYAIDLPPVDKPYGFSLQSSLTENLPTTPVTIELLPFEYEGYLVTDGVDDKAVSKQFKSGENFTVILDFKFPVKKISYCGFDLSTKVRIQNLQGSGVYVVLKGNKTLIPSNVVRAVTSEGKVYDENWNEYNIVPGNISSNYTMVNLGFDGSNQFAESATKLAGIYSSTLSKDDCIKAYNYLQTLKAK